MIAIVSHDSGGAEVLSSWLCQEKPQYQLAIQGPAVAIFERKLGNIEILTLEEVIDSCDWVLCGSSWQSDLEKKAILLAKKCNKKVITFLDHWVNYPERFKLKNTYAYPDEIWVGDSRAYKIANEIFPKILIKQKSNPYFKDIITDLENFESKTPSTSYHSALYVCEPISEHALEEYGDRLYYGYTEVDALKFFLENCDILNINLQEIRIRPHPSENRSKYEWAKNFSALVVETESDKTLIQQIQEADLVAGCESMAMIVGLIAKKQVVSSIPFGGKQCGLPHDEIVHLQDIIEKRRNQHDI